MSMFDELVYYANSTDHFDPAFVLLYNEINIMCLVMLAIIFVRAGRELHPLALMKEMRKSLIWCFIIILTDLVWFDLTQDTDGFHGDQQILFAIKSLYFFSATELGFRQFRYFQTALKDSFSSKALKYLTFAPIPIHIIFLIVNIKIPFLFYYDVMDGVLTYKRGNFFFLNYLFAVLFFTAVLMPVVVRLMLPKYFAMREQLLGTLAFLVGPFIASCLQYSLRRIPFFCFGVTIGIWILYMNQLSMMISKESLTGLNNRRQMIHDLDHALKEHKDDGNVAVLMMDLDFFKDINDTYGHATGDEALVTAANILKDAAKTHGTRPSIARYGGDEFIMMVTAADPSVPEMFAEKIREIAAGRKVPGTDMYLQFSIGIGTNEGTDDMQTVLKRADNAMYRSKRKHHAMRSVG